jgi:hypothetical protein
MRDEGEPIGYLSSSKCDKLDPSSYGTGTYSFGGSEREKEGEFQVKWAP